MVTTIPPEDARLRAMFESFPDAILVGDAGGRCLDLNPAAMRLLGYTREDVQGMALCDLVVTETAAPDVDLQNLLSQEHRRELRLRRKDGRTVPVESSVCTLAEPEGDIHVMVLHDLTLRPGETRRLELAAIVESSGDAIFSKTLDGIVTTWNEAAERLYGYKAAEIIGRSVDVIIPPDRPNELGDILARLRRGERIEHFETERIAKDGRRLPISVTISPIRDADGTVVGASAVTRDITRRRQVEQALRASHNHLQAILRSAEEGITVQDAGGRFIYANNAAARLCGFPSAEALLSAPPDRVAEDFEILDDDGTPVATERLPGRIAMREGRMVEAVLRYRSASMRIDRWSLVRSVPAEDPESPLPMVINVFQDITALKQEEIRVQFLAKAGEALGQTLDYEGTLAQIAQLAVPSFADWAAVDVLGADGTIRRLATAHADPAKLAWAEELEGRYPTKPDDPTGPARVIRTGEPEFYASVPEDLLEAFRVDEEMARILDELHLTSWIVVPLQARGRTLGALTFVHAESERHYSETDLRFARDVATRAALALDNARLYRDALAAIHVRDEFLASVSHDLRTPLTTIRGSAQLVARQLRRLDVPETERASASLASIDRASRRMEMMIGALLDITRLESGRPLDVDRQQIDLVSLVRELVEEHQRGAPGHRLGLDARATQIQGAWDPVRLERVVDNLLSNAIKYSPDGGRVQVSLSVEGDPDSDVATAVVEVEDEGIGIPAADLSRIFDRFRRGSNVPSRTPGIGIGLTGAKQIAELHGGSLTVVSQEGAGSRFRLQLPIVLQDAEED